MFLNKFNALASVAFSVIELYFSCSTRCNFDMHLNASRRTLVRLSIAYFGIPAVRDFIFVRRF